MNIVDSIVLYENYARPCIVIELNALFTIYTFPMLDSLSYSC
jgi:hypothetical protein